MEENKKNNLRLEGINEYNRRKNESAKNRQKIKGIKKSDLTMERQKWFANTSSWGMQDWTNSSSSWVSQRESFNGNRMSNGIGVFESLAGSLIKKIPFMIKFGICVAAGLILFVVLFIALIFTVKSVEDEDEIPTIQTSIVNKNDLCFPSANSYFCYPITNMTGTTGQFGSTGSHWKSIHTGTDFVGPEGKAKCVAVAPGTVYSVSGKGSYGNHVIIEHQLDGIDGTKSQIFYTMYCHMENIAVKQDDEVQQGQVLGMMGKTRKCYRSALSF